MSLDFTGVSVFALFIGAPAIVIACMPPRWRLACLFLGLILAFATERLVSSPHDPMAPMIFVGLAIALAAALVEIPAFAIRTRRRRRAVARGESIDEKSPMRFWPKRR